jgi:hypothetical protein
MRYAHSVNRLRTTRQLNFKCFIKKIVPVVVLPESGQQLQLNVAIFMIPYTSYRYEISLGKIIIEKV